MSVWPELRLRLFSKIETVTWFGFTSATFISSTRSHICLRWLLPPLLTTALINSLKVTRFGCNPSWAISIIKHRALSNPPVCRWALISVLNETTSAIPAFFCPLHPCLGCLQVAALHTSIKHCVVDDSVHVHTTSFQRIKDADCTLEVALCGTISDHGDVLGNVGRGGIQQFLCNVPTTTLESCIHQAALHAGIYSKRPLSLRGTHIRSCEERLQIKLIDVASFFVLLAVSIEADETCENGQLLGLHVTIQLLCHLGIGSLCAEAKNRACKVRAHLHSLLDHFIEELLHSNRINSHALDQEMVCCTCELHFLFPCKLFN